MYKREGMKIIWIGKSATKPRTGEGSQTILFGVGHKARSGGHLFGEDIVDSCMKV